MPGPCVSWGFPLSLRCKLATRTAQCIGSLSCWGLRDGGEALSPGTRWGHPGPRSRERAHGVCSSAAPPSPISMGDLPLEGTAQRCVRARVRSEADAVAEGHLQDGLRRAVLHRPGHTGLPLGAEGMELLPGRWAQPHTAGAQGASEHRPQTSGLGLGGAACSWNWTP